jgi:hypothetical protein
MDNEQPEPKTRPYVIQIRTSRITEDLTVEAVDRLDAVQQAFDAYRSRKIEEPIKGHLEVNDPYNEVHYVDGIDCRNRLYKLLPQDAIDRVVQESKGRVEQSRDEKTPVWIRRTEAYVAEMHKKSKKGEIKKSPAAKSNQGARVRSSRKREDLPDEHFPAEISDAARELLAERMGAESSSSPKRGKEAEPWLTSRSTLENWSAASKGQTKIPTVTHVAEGSILKTSQKAPVFSDSRIGYNG